ncbi:hypothetical protein [Maioricimonas sp. JC845]|uniref:hypothetical protein n=1 Tax=Maioricimonas sp. JC845 TaxID=3232138 RepID=UPI0034597D04
MSVARQDGTKVVLPRSGPDEFWQTIREHYAGDDPRIWKYLAMLALRENAGWPLDQIGAVFGHPKGHVTRCLARIKTELRKRFEMAPEFLDVDESLCPEDRSPGRNVPR